MRILIATAPILVASVALAQGKLVYGLENVYGDDVSTTAIVKIANPEDGTPVDAMYFTCTFFAGDKPIDVATSVALNIQPGQDAFAKMMSFKSGVTRAECRLAEQSP